MKKILITGANGFLGSWLTRKLIDEGCEVKALIRPNTDITEFEKLNIEIAYGDVTKINSIKEAMTNCESVFHLAGLISYQRSDRAAMHAVNVEGTKNVITSFLDCKLQGRLVHLSSVVAIGASFGPEFVLNEKSKFNLSKFELGYFESKRLAEEAVHEAVRNKGLDAVILNPSTIYGAGDALKGSRKNQIKVAQGKMLFYPPGGVSIVAVEDVIEGIIKAWRIGKKGERYILSGENLMLKDVFKIIANCAQSSEPKYEIPKFVMFALAGIDNFLSQFSLKGPIPSETAIAAALFHWFDNSKAKQELGMSFKDAKYAIENSVNWMKENGVIQK